MGDSTKQGKTRGWEGNHVLFEAFGCALASILWRNRLRGWNCSSRLGSFCWYWERRLWLESRVSRYEASRWAIAWWSPSQPRESSGGRYRELPARVFAWGGG